MIQELRKSLAISPVVFYDREHRYFLGDRELSGVTSCLSRQIFKDKYDAIPEDVLQAAAERGHKVHQDIQNMAKGVTRTSSVALHAKRNAKRV